MVHCCCRWLPCRWNSASMPKRAKPTKTSFTLRRCWMMRCASGWTFSAAGSAISAVTLRNLLNLQERSVTSFTTNLANGYPSREPRPGGCNCQSISCGNTIRPARRRRLRQLAGSGKCPQTTSRWLKQSATTARHRTNNGHGLKNMAGWCASSGYRGRARSR